MEEAITVIEAVARVPQQEHKWGAKAVAAAWPALYPFYYATVIAACVGQVKTPENINIISINQRIIIFLRRLFRAKPAYYP